MADKRIKCLGIHVFFLLLMSLTSLLAACSNPTQKVTAVVTASQSHLTLKSTPVKEQATYQPIPANSFGPGPDWKEVLHLGRIQNNIISTQGSFDSTAPYTILFICEGTGSIQIQFVPQGSTTANCDPTLKLHGITNQTPLTKGPVNVSVTTPANNVWEVSVQLSKK